MGLALTGGWKSVFTSEGWPITSDRLFRTFVFDTGSVFETTSELEVTLVFDTGSVFETPSGFEATSVFETHSVLKVTSVFETRSVFKMRSVLGTGSAFETAPMFKMGSVFETGLSFKSAALKQSCLYFNAASIAAFLASARRTENDLGSMIEVLIALAGMSMKRREISR